MRIALVASEAAPYSKTGGLADVTGALFNEYARMGQSASLFVPLYRETKERFGTAMKDTKIELAVSLGGATK
jgi:starch synthase